MLDIKYGRKRKGIVKELREKISDWLYTIDDDTVRTAAHDDVIITGGSIASMLLGEPVNDFDMYFRTKETTKLIADYYVSKFKEATIDNPKLIDVIESTIINCKGLSEDRIVIRVSSAGIAEDGTPIIDTTGGILKVEEIDEVHTDRPKYRPVFLSANAITLSGKVQLVTRFYGEPEQIHSNYDFAHAMSYYDYSNECLELPGEALECLLSRTLVYRGSLYPIASLFRTKKFLQRGWRISAGEQLKMAWQISELDLKNKDVIVEQLTGVDMSYLFQLIDSLRAVNTDKINSTYIATIIDRIFN